jgi:PRP38 family
LINEGAALPIWGDKSNYNVNNLLKENIHLSQYFKDLFRIQTFEEMLEELDDKCKYAEPWAHAASAVPSSMFCLLLRLFMMRLSLF